MKTKDIQVGQHYAYTDLITHAHPGALHMQRVEVTEIRPGGRVCVIPTNGDRYIQEHSEVQQQKGRERVTRIRDLVGEQAFDQYLRVSLGNGTVSYLHMSVHSLEAVLQAASQEGRNEGYFQARSETEEQ